VSTKPGQAQIEYEYEYEYEYDPIAHELQVLA
jgi:hypothetical protein